MIDIKTPLTIRLALEQMQQMMRPVLGLEGSIQIVLSRCSREFRRHLGIEQAQQFFRKYADEISLEQSVGDTVVKVPPATFRLGGTEAFYWDYLGAVFDEGMRLFGIEWIARTMISIVVANLREKFTIEQIRELLHEFADTIPQASLYDVKDEHGR